MSESEVLVRKDKVGEGSDLSEKSSEGVKVSSEDVSGKQEESWESIAESVRSMVIANFAPPDGDKSSEVSLDTRFNEDLGADSLDTVELIMEVEDSFGVTISDDEAQKIATVRDAVNSIARSKGIPEQNK